VLGYLNEDIKAAIASIDRSLAFNPSSARLAVERLSPVVCGRTGVCIADDAS
jgi:hypothetical protein